MAKEVGGSFIATHSWLGAEQVLYVKRLVNSSFKKEWQQVAENGVEVNLWEQRAKECSSLRP